MVDNRGDLRHFSYPNKHMDMFLCKKGTNLLWVTVETHHYYEAPTRYIVLMWECTLMKDPPLDQSDSRWTEVNDGSYRDIEEWCDLYKYMSFGDYRRREITEEEFAFMKEDFFTWWTTESI